jgi:hypothetical protein
VGVVFIVVVCDHMGVFLGWWCWGGGGGGGGGENRVAYRILVGKTEGKGPLGRPRRRCKDNINMDLQEMRCGGMDWIDVA